MRDFHAGGTQQRTRRFRRPCREEDAVTGLGADMGGQALAFGVGQVFGDRPAQRAVVADQHIGQALVAALLGELLPAVQRATRLRRPTRHHHRTDVRRLEHPERGVGEELCAFDELQPEPQVGSVRAEPSHRLGVADPRHRSREVVTDQRPHRFEHLFGDGDDIVGLDEAHLHVELGEFRLPVGAEILVAIAAGDLVVALHAGHHQQLLEQLRALRQGVERAGLQPGRYQEVARAFRRRTRHRRSLDLDEVMAGQHPARRGIYLGAQPNCVARARRDANPDSDSAAGLPHRRARRAGMAAARTPPALSETSR